MPGPHAQEPVSMLKPSPNFSKRSSSNSHRPKAIDGNYLSTSRAASWLFVILTILPASQAIADANSERKQNPADSGQDPITIGYIDIDKCPDSASSDDDDTNPPNQVCEVVVPKLTQPFATLQGSNCLQEIRLDPREERIILYEVKEPTTFRFVGTQRSCEPAVVDAPQCDVQDNPVLGLSCSIVDENGRFGECPDSCRPQKQSICYLEKGRQLFELRIRNDSKCRNIARLEFLLAIKAIHKVKIPGSNGLPKQFYCPQYLVDPTIIQRPNCPDGCP